VGVMLPVESRAVPARRRGEAREKEWSSEETDADADWGKSRVARARSRRPRGAIRATRGRYPAPFARTGRVLESGRKSGETTLAGTHKSWLFVGRELRGASSVAAAVAFAGFFADAAAFAPGFGADLDAFESFPMSPSVVGVFALLFFVDFAFERPAVSAPALAAAFSAPAASAGCRAGSAVVSADPSEDGGSAGALLREGFLSCCSTPLVSKSCGVKIGGREGERAVAMRAPRGGTRATTLQARPGKSDSPRTHLHRRRTTLALPREGRGRRRDRG